jgi:hypothetical protein
MAGRTKQKQVLTKTVEVTYVKKMVNLQVLAKLLDMGFPTYTTDLALPPPYSKCLK